LRPLKLLLHIRLQICLGKVGSVLFHVWKFKDFANGWTFGRIFLEEELNEREEILGVLGGNGLDGVVGDFVGEREDVAALEGVLHPERNTLRAVSS
jgi:hypothetical protein